MRLRSCKYGFLPKSILSMLTFIIVTGIGFGKHLWNLQHGQLKQCLRFCISHLLHHLSIPYANRNLIVYVSWSTYVIVLGLIKISLLMFYLQIFPSRRFRIGCYITLAYIIISTIVIYLATIFACLPIKAFWDRDVKGKCLDINALAYANSGSAIAQDIIILALPLSVIRGLKMKRYKKIAVGLMFSVGALYVFLPVPLPTGLYISPSTCLNITNTHLAVV